MSFNKPCVTGRAAIYNIRRAEDYSVHRPLESDRAGRSVVYARHLTDLKRYLLLSPPELAGLRRTRHSQTLHIFFTVRQLDSMEDMLLTDITRFPQAVILKRFHYQLFTTSD